MPRVEFTHILQRHLDVPVTDVAGATVREALESVFADNPRLRGYVLDDQGALRKHVALFVDSQAATLDDPAGRELFVMQALSGG